MSEVKKAQTQFYGTMIDIGPEITSVALSHYLHVYNETHPKPANTVLVFRDIDPSKITLPEEWQHITVKPWQYIHSKNIVMVGVWS